MLLLLLIAAAWAERCHHLVPGDARCAAGADISFKRQAFVADPAKHISLFLHARSPDSVLLHLLVVFVDADPRLHNALVLTPAALLKVDDVTYSHFGHRLPVTSRGRLLSLPYSTASVELGPLVDGYLSLDYYTDLWTQFVGWRLEQNTLRLLAHAVHHDDDAYAGHHVLQCTRWNATQSVKQCFVTLASTLRVNGVASHYGLRIDFGAARNLLPRALYARWLLGGERELRLSFLRYVGAQEEELIFLNEQFDYALGEGEEIVLGVDLLHYFQRVEYHVTSGRLSLSFNHVYRPRDDFTFGYFLLVLFVGLLLWSLFWFLVSPNFYVFLTVLQERAAGRSARTLAFPYYVAFHEAFATLCAVVLWFLTAFYGGESWHRAPIHPHEQRQLLLLAFSLFHALLMAGLLVVQRDLSWRAARYYVKRTEFFFTREERRLWNAEAYEALKRVAAQHDEPVRVADVILRALVLQGLLMSNLLFIVNYLSQEKPLFVSFYLIILLVLTYLYVRWLYVAALYVARHRYTDRRVPLGYLMVLVSCAVAFIAFLSLSFYAGFIAFFRAVNSTYPDAVLRGAAFAFVALTVVGALLLSVFKPLTQYAAKVVE